MSGGDSSAPHHRLSAITKAVYFLWRQSLLCSQSSSSPSRLLGLGASVKINNVSDADSNPYGHLLQGSAAEGCRNAASPPRATGRELR